MQINYKDYPILVIDDEDDFLAVFRRLSGKFHLDTEKYPSKALEKIRRSRYCLIISDNKMRNAASMPEDERAGLALLRKAREIDDHTLRVLVTGWSKEGIQPSLSTQADVNILLDKLDIITDQEWDEALTRMIEHHMESRGLRH